MRGTRRRRARRLFRNPTAAAGILVVAGVLMLAVLGPILVPHSPVEFDPSERLQPPSLRHPLGTDQFGRDLLSRIAEGARLSWLVGVLGTGVAMAAGTVMGTLAGYHGGWLDESLMRATDLILAIPYIVLAVALLATFGPGFTNVVLVISLTRVPGFARLVRSSVLSLKEQEFVEAARAIGSSDFSLVAKHILPNAMAPVLVLSTLSVATAINAEAALSFLGLGLQPPMPSWGILVADGRAYLRDAPWIAILPGLAISVAALGFNLLGDALRDWFDVRIRD